MCQNTGFTSTSFVLTGNSRTHGREPMVYCVTTIASSGYYSLALQLKITATFIILKFWSGIVLHRVYLDSAPRGMLLPRSILI